MHYSIIDSGYYCGVDVHPKRSYINVLDNTGIQYVNRNIVNNFEISRKLLILFYQISSLAVNRRIVTTGLLIVVMNIRSHFILDMRYT